MLSRSDGAGPFDQRLQQNGIAIVNLSGLKFFAGLGQFVASRNDCGANLATDQNFSKTLRSQQSEPRGDNSLPFPENLLSFSQIASALSHKFVNIDVYIDDDLVAGARDIFLHHDRICAGRHWRAGENPDRLAV